jgi:energy-coupling factor transporter ATP-binding protein EcfA2
MARRRIKALTPYQDFFCRPQACDPVANVLAEAGNVLVSHGLQKLGQSLSDRLGLSDPYEQIKLNRSLLQLREIEARIARAEQREAAERTRAEELRLRQQKQDLLNEKQARFYDLKIQEKELEIERAKQSVETAVGQRTEIDLHIRTEPISGALELTANPEGLTGDKEQQQAYKEWLDSFEEGKVVLILGKRGSGKSALAAKIAEYMMGVHRMATYWIGLPDKAQELLPHWIKIVDDPGKCPMSSFLLCDEAGVNYLSLLFNTSQNRFMRRLLMIARQRRISLAFATQSSRDVDWSIVRQADSIIFKEPGLNQPDSERPDIKRKAVKATLAFKEIPDAEKVEAAYVFDDSFEGIIKSTLPGFWTEDLSHIYAHLDLGQLEREGKNRHELDKTISADTKQLADAALDRQILELRKQDMGIQKIAKTLGVSVWRVRKCLKV